jgi:alpha-glucosidase (family GH31 glycosyl hydrolase)
LNATHYGGLKEANVHPFFGYLQAFSTSLFLISKGEQPFIISRSTTVGFNQFGFHWTGDNYANF